MSLTIDAPATMARRATSAFVVSTEIGIPERVAIASTTGRIRRISSSNATGDDPGRVDQAVLHGRCEREGGDRRVAPGDGDPPRLRALADIEKLRFAAVHPIHLLHPRSDASQMRRVK